MATKATERQRRYDSVHCTGFYLKLNNENDSDVIAKLSTLKSKQGYIKQLIRDDIANSVPNSDNYIVFVPVPKIFMEALTREAKKNSCSVPELIWNAALEELSCLHDISVQVKDHCTMIYGIDM